MQCFYALRGLYEMGIWYIYAIFKERDKSTSGQSSGVSSNGPSAFDILINMHKNFIHLPSPRYDTLHVPVICQPDLTGSKDSRGCIFEYITKKSDQTSFICKGFNTFLVVL